MSTCIMTEKSPHPQLFLSELKKKKIAYRLSKPTFLQESKADAARKFYLDAPKYIYATR